MYLFVHPFCGDWLSSYTFWSKCSFIHRKSSNLKQTNLNLQVKPTRHLSYSNTNCMGFSNPECDLSVAYRKIFHMSLFAGLAWLSLLHTHDETFKEVIRRFVLCLQTQHCLPCLIKTHYCFSFP